MQRIVFNCQTKERTVIDWTPEEIADAQARTSAEEAEKLANAQREAAMTVEQKLARIGLTVDDIKAAVNKE